MNVVERADVRMIELRDRARFSLEALPRFHVLGEMLGKNFDGDGSIEARVDGLVDLSHAAGA